MVQTYKSKRLL